MQMIVVVVIVFVALIHQLLWVLLENIYIQLVVRDRWWSHEKG